MKDRQPLSLIQTRRANRKKTRIKVALIAFVALLLVFAITLIVVTAELHKKKKQPGKEIEDVTLSNGQTLLVDDNGVLDYYRSTGKDSVMLTNLTLFVRKYFDLVNTLGVDAAYSQYYATDLLALFGFSLPVDTLNDDIVSMYKGLGGEGKLVLTPVSYDEMGEYFLLNFDLKTDANLQDYVNLTYTIYFDEVYKSYKLLDFDIKNIYKLSYRFDKATGGAERVPGTSGMFFDDPMKER